jgi:nitrous oxidase accessory protein NosD
MATLQHIIIVLLTTVCLAIPAMGMTAPLTNTRLSPWLYVGGSGPGNYTTIQAAVDNATDGDTVFVYDDSSPYHEQVIINHSITLLGEQRQTTVLNATVGYPGPYSPLLRIQADNVTVSGFTFLPISNGFGMEILTNNNRITDLSVERTGYGIFIASGNRSAPLLQGNMIDHSFFMDNGNGIQCVGVRRTTIAHNDFQGNDRGVVLEHAFESNVSSNFFTGAETCVLDDWGYHNTFARNTMNHSDLGIGITMCKDLITENNFEDAGFGSLFVNAPVYEALYKLRGMVNQSWAQYYKDYRVIGVSHWRHNYWGKPSLFPHPVFGFSMFCVFLLLIGEGGLPNRVAFDWRPALTPFQPY